MIIFHCPKCGEEMEISDRMAEKKVECVECSARITVPDKEKSKRSQEEAVEERTMARGGKQTRRRNEDEEFEENSSRRRHRARERYDDDEDEEEGRSRRSFKRLPRHELRQIAIYQKGILFCILALLAVFIGFGFLPEQIRFVGTIVYLVVAITSAVFSILLSIKVYGPVVGILFGILALVPFISLVFLLIVNGRATTTLQLHGYKVGLMGAALSDFD